MAAISRKKGAIEGGTEGTQGIYKEEQKCPSVIQFDPTELHQQPYLNRIDISFNNLIVFLSGITYLGL